MGSTIYVEATIRGNLDEIWAKTQDPKLHERWDLRFSQIKYLLKQADGPQRFEYRTRLGFGLEIRGEGEAVGEKQSPSERTSALKFWSHDRKSLISVGSGYWKYQENGDAVRFLTAYDYKTRLGPVGHIFDRLIFRPLMGWATAWSFDRLRLWIEKGIDPGLSLERSLIHAVSRIAIALTWLYHGLIPKILYPESGELELLRSAPMMSTANHSTALFIGLLEIGWAVAILLTWHKRWALGLNALLSVLLTSVVFLQPSTLTAPFNPVTLNLCMFAISIVGWLSSRNLPSARRCLRKPQKAAPSTKRLWARSSTASTR